MQIDSENEIRAVADQMQAKLRHFEGLMTIKEEEIMAARREI